MGEKESNSILLAIVGMPGAGKSEVIAYLKTKGIPFVRFGQITDDSVSSKGLPLTPENERLARENLRKELGMEAYAIKSEPKIRELTKTHPVVAIDGLYSWEEYKYLIRQFDNLILVCIYAQPNIRYKRLSARFVRPLSLIEAKERDKAEIEKLNKGGPIAIADFLIENNSDNLQELHEKIDSALDQIFKENQDR